MADGEKRIVELTETQTFGNGDYLPLDNISNSETKKIEAKKLGITYTMTDTEDGFSFDGSNGYHYEKVIPKDAQMSYEDYEDLTEAEKMDGSNRFIPDYPEEEKQPEIWTRVGRTPLETDAKTISPAINELKERIDDSDTEIEEIKSNLTDLEPTSYSTQGLSSSNATIDGGGYFKIGKVVFVNILITANSNIGNWTDIITGLPNPLIENITLITTNISNTDKQPIDFHLISRNNTGAIATMSNGSAVTSGYKYSITGYYLTN